MVTTEERKYLELCKALIEEGQELAQILKENNELEWQQSNKTGQLKKKQSHIQQLKDHYCRLELVYENKNRYTPQQAPSSTTPNQIPSKPTSETPIKTPSKHIPLKHSFDTGH